MDIKWIATNRVKRGIIRSHRIVQKYPRTNLGYAYYQEIGRYEENRLAYSCD